MKKMIAAVVATMVLALGSGCLARVDSGDVEAGDAGADTESSGDLVCLRDGSCEALEGGAPACADGRLEPGVCPTGVTSCKNGRRSVVFFSAAAEPCAWLNSH